MSDLIPAPERPNIHQPEDYITPTLNHGLRIWWAYFWPVALATVVAMVIAGIIGAVRMKQGSVNLEEFNLIVEGTAVISIIAAGLVSFQYLLHKRFRQFRIALYPNPLTPGAVPLKPTFRHALRLWWAFNWRAALWSLLFQVVAAVPIAFIMGALSFIPGTVAFAVLLLRVVIESGVSLFVIYSSILDEEFGSFSVRLVPRGYAPEEMLRRGLSARATDPQPE